MLLKYIAMNIYKLVGILISIIFLSGCGHAALQPNVEGDLIVTNTASMVDKNSIAEEVSKAMEADTLLGQSEFFTGTWLYQGSDPTGQIGLRKEWTFRNGAYSLEAYPPLVDSGTYTVEEGGDGYVSITLSSTGQVLKLAPQEDGTLLINDEGPYTKKTGAVLRGTWRAESFDESGAPLSRVEWTFYDNTFEINGYPPLRREGTFVVKSETVDNIELFLTNQAGTPPVADRSVSFAFTDANTFFLEGVEYKKQ